MDRSQRCRFFKLLILIALILSSSFIRRCKVLAILEDKVELQELCDIIVGPSGGGYLNRGKLILNAMKIKRVSKHFKLKLRFALRIDVNYALAEESFTCDHICTDLKCIAYYRCCIV